MIGYNWSFVSGGLALILFAFIYAVVCGTGHHIDEEPVSALSNSKENMQKEEAVVTEI